jgi:hypothetical protein
VPGHFGLWGIGGPFIVVEVAGPRVTVRLRPKFLARLLGVAPLIAEPGRGLTVTTSKVRAGWGWFIEFQRPGERQHSFMTTTARKDEVLSFLAEVGFEVPAAESNCR